MWDTWQHSTIAQAHAQNVAEVLDESHAPTDAVNKVLFVEKQKFMFVVFKCTLLTDTSKALVCQQKMDFDAQTIYKSLKHQPTTCQSGQTLGNLGASSLTFCDYTGDGAWPARHPTSQSPYTTGQYSSTFACEHTLSSLYHGDTKR